MNLLRLATTELARGGAAHGVVHAAVNLARAAPDSRPMAGLVNAVLRKIAAAPPDLDAMPPGELPKPLRKLLIAAWGKPAVAAMEAVFAQTPPLDLTSRDGDAAALAARVGGEVLPTGSVRLRETGQVSALPGYEDGAFWVQDAAAALPARVLAAQPGERMLDLCAAPGGKAMQLAAAGAQVTAVDDSAARLARLRENLTRTGLRAEVVQSDALAFRGGSFDAVLLDPPCSATGTIRRHPDLPQARRPIDLPALTDLQARMADHAASLLRPGGRLVICTCSLLPEEGEALAEALPARTGLVPDPAALTGMPADWRSGASGLRLRPDFWADTGGIDGFFIAAFRRPA